MEIISPKSEPKRRESTLRTNPASGDKKNSSSQKLDLLSPVQTTIESFFSLANLHTITDQRIFYVPAITARYVTRNDLNRGMHLERFS